MVVTSLKMVVVETSLVMVVTSLVMVVTSLVMVETSLVMVVTSLVMVLTMSTSKSATMSALWPPKCRINALWGPRDSDRNPKVMTSGWE